MSVRISVAELKFVEGGNTIWVHSDQGATVLRIKTMGKITTQKCATSPFSHADIVVDKDIDFCLSDDVKDD